VHFLEQAANLPQPLLNLQLRKSATDPWKIAGIASDESKDVEGDVILRKALDVSYAAQRGYINWDHRRAPEDQIGYLSRCEIIDADKTVELKEKLGIDVPATATVYIEGELYKSVPRAIEVARILESTPVSSPGLGLSLDGVMQRDVATRSVLKAVVRGVAITPYPAHPLTTARLAKALGAMRTLIDDPAEFAFAEAGQLESLRKFQGDERTSDQGLTTDEAILTVLKHRPTWTLRMAAAVVHHTRGGA
jgi:hypothetical protein